MLTDVQIDRAKFSAACEAIERERAWVGKKAGLSRQRLQHYLDGRHLPPEVYPKLIAILGTTDLLRPSAEPADLNQTSPRSQRPSPHQAAEPVALPVETERAA